jgi:hemerythrin-like domain-containing protein
MFFLKEFSMETPQTCGPNSDAVALLTEDHSKVKQLFREFDSIKSETEQASLKSELVQQICFELTVHTQIEEDLFYPAARSAIGADNLIDEALAEHAGAKELINLLEGMEPDDVQIDQTVDELRRQVEHHITEEENNLFPRVRASAMNLGALCSDLRERKEELESELAAAAMPLAASRSENPSAGQASS